MVELEIRRGLFFVFPLLFCLPVWCYVPCCALFRHFLYQYVIFEQWENLLSCFPFSFALKSCKPCIIYRHFNTYKILPFSCKYCFSFILEVLKLSPIMQVLALVGDQLDYGDNICGAVLSIRFNEDILSVWNRNASDHQVSNH